jgi:octaprenyl-diphosphate synthase
LVHSAEPFLQSVAARLAERVRAFDPAIAAMARYALANQGKQLRPALVSLSGGTAGTLGESHVTVAVIIEMVHLATLVHDDVMDEARMRRQRPTLAARWGNEVSVLLGDCLFAEAMRLAAGFPTPDICRAVGAATKNVCTGEILQTMRRGDFLISRADYFQAVTMKTAELFSLSCELGARLAGADATGQQALRDYGLALGTAYQVYDDCLDIFGTEAQAGKSLGTDLATGKVTLPVLIARERLAAAGREQLLGMLRTWKPEMAPALSELLRQANALAESRAVIGGLLTTARNALAGLPESEPLLGLFGLTAFLGQQVEALGTA